MNVFSVLVDQEEVVKVLTSAVFESKKDHTSFRKNLHKPINDVICKTFRFT